LPGVHYLPAHMLEDAHATRQLHCQWRSSPYRAEDAESAHGCYPCKRCVRLSLFCIQKIF